MYDFFLRIFHISITTFKLVAVSNSSGLTFVKRFHFGKPDLSKPLKPRPAPLLTTSDKINAK